LKDYPNTETVNEDIRHRNLKELIGGHYPKGSVRHCEVTKVASAPKEVIIPDQRWIPGFKRIYFTGKYNY